ncbi:GNAT family N-acetyltransferase [Sciscionella marina]|uniref:GNAT family N-acetyltransferase n=1 Tax=Sciscionella marina TaxID=508770 RepID=UPI00037A4932|nr:GNAT family N-acetyltransferase [Sciscionella marina]
MRIIPFGEQHREAALRLNNAAVPKVNELDATELRSVLGHSALALTAEISGEFAGLVVVIGPGTGYESENYRWFEASYRDYWYLDRIVVDENHRGAGIGAALHQAVFEEAKAAGIGEIALEVNIEPPNPGSLRFHERLGFAQVGTLQTGEGKRVSLMTRAVG